MKRQWKRKLSIVLTLAMIFGMTGTNTIFAGQCEHYRSHTAECGDTGGMPDISCTHEHTKDCYDDAEENASDSNAGEPVNCNHICDGESGCITEKPGCRHEHDEDCGYAPAGTVTIAAFEPLPDETLWQGCNFGEADEDDLVLPDVLSGTDEGGGAVTIDGVIWESEPVFDPEVSAFYRFSPVLPPGYRLAEGVTAPVISVFIQPEGGLQMQLAASGDITTAAGLEEALKSTTPTTINVTEDILLTGTDSERVVEMGADHILNIAGGKTLTIGEDTMSGRALIDINGHTLTITGGSGSTKGKVLIDNHSSNGIYAFTGTLNLEDVEVEVINSYYGGLGNIETMIIRDGADVILNGDGSQLMMFDNGQTVTVESGGTVTITKGHFVLYSSELYINGGGAVHVNNSSDYGLIVGSHGGKLKLLNGGTLDGSGMIYLISGGMAEGLNGKFTDRGRLFTASGEVTVGSAAIPPSADGLTSGVYSWDSGSSTFSKPGYTVSGTVKDSAGNGISGAAVMLEYWTGEAPYEVEAGTTDSDGMYTFSDVNDVDEYYIVKVSKSGYTESASEYFSVESDVNVEDIILAGGVPAPTAYTVTFDPGSGSVVTTSMETGMDGKLANLPVPTWSGHRFDGWYTRTSGGTRITTSYVFNADTTVFAQWTYTGGSGNGGGSGNSGGSGSGGSSVTGTSSTDTKRGIVNSVTGIVTGSGSGHSKWEQGTARDGSNTWKLQYADGTYAAGTMVTVEDGSTQEQLAWEMINGAWYAFGADGYAKSGWVFDPALGGHFYIDINTGMKTGWQQLDGNWYYFNPNSDGRKGIWEEGKNKES